MARAIDLDRNGAIVLTQGLAFGPQPGQLSLADLKPADVLIWYSASRSPIRSAIREFSGGPYSHVGIYVGDGFSVDASLAGVERVLVEDLMADSSYASVMRHDSLTANQQAAVVTAACKSVGRGYAWFDSITLPARRRAYWQRDMPLRKLDLLALIGRGLTVHRRLRPPSQKNTFCSRMVVETYTYADADYFHTDDVEECVNTPNDLAAGKFFMYEGWLCDTDKPTWHPLDPNSPEYVRQRRWHFSLARIFRGTSTGGK
jgi:hypothetical protein